MDLPKGNITTTITTNTIVSLPTNDTPQDNNNNNNTATFLIGFGILLAFVVVGIIASVFLCFTLKKDQYLWEVERERQLSEKNGANDLNNDKDDVDDVN